MIKVGITGNIGTGKSIVCRIFETLGVPVFHADEEAKFFLLNEDVRQTLVLKFGKEILTDGIIDRQKLGIIVFDDDEALKFLNSVIHPLVKQSLMYWIKLHNNQHYILQEAAILFESGFNKEFDKIITVVSPPELAIRRVIERDQITRTDVEKRMKHQWDQDKKMELSDFIIFNDEKQMVVPQVLKIHNVIMGIIPLTG
jgi:dephospho-CoA kinase